MPSEECYNDIQNIVQQWKNNENAPISVPNECKHIFVTQYSELILRHTRISMLNL